MKHFWKRLTAMVAALMLLCTCALAQDGNLCWGGRRRLCLDSHDGHGG